MQCFNISQAGGDFVVLSSIHELSLAWILDLSVLTFQKWDDFINILDWGCTPEDKLGT